MLTNRAFLLWCCGAFLAAAGRADAEGTRAAAEFDWGVLGGRFEDANGDTRTRALGPFFERIVSPRGERFRAARPFYCALERPSESRRHAEYLWPLAVSRDFQKEHSLRVLLAYYRNFDVEDPNPRYHVRILPFYFQGRDIRGRSYKALFPLGGRIHEFLGQDEMSFFLFPLWSYSSINSVQTHSVLWPVYSRTRGKGISRFRVFPFYGYARHRARFEKGFVAWPFYTWARYTYPDDQGRGYIVFPLWGRFVMPDQRAWLILPPLFRFSRGERLNYSYAPWPFVQASSGEIEKRYLWPLWGRRSLRGITTSFFLWPVFRAERGDRGHSVYRGFYALPFYQSQVETPRPDAGVGRTARLHRKLWPMGSYRREGDVRRWRVLDLWPAREGAPVDRNWAPLWTVFSHEAVGDRADTELAWGLWRQRRRGPDRCAASLFPLWAWDRDDRPGGAREWNALRGLVGRRRDEHGVTWRFLYMLRWGGSPDGQETKP